MNKLKGFLLFTFSMSILSFYGCNSDEDENANNNDIIGVWSVTAASADFNIGETSLVDYLINTLQLSQIEAQAFETAISEGFTDGFDGTIEFKVDNTYIAEFGDDPAETGTWELFDNGNKIRITETGDDSSTELDILSVTSSTMVLAFNESESDDLDGDGTDEEISIEIEMTLQKQ